MHFSFLLFVWFFLIAFSSLLKFSKLLFISVVLQSVHYPFIWVFCGSFSSQLSPWFLVVCCFLDCLLAISHWVPETERENGWRYFEALDDCSRNLKHLYIIFISSPGRISRPRRENCKSQLIESPRVLCLLEKALRNIVTQWRPQSGQRRWQQEAGVRERVSDLKTKNNQRQWSALWK